MRAQVLISFYADDRPGRVERLSELVEAHGGNWSESRLSRLGGRFAGVVLLSLPQARLGDLREALTALKNEGIVAQLTVADDDDGEAREQRRIQLLGPDRQGIVHELTQALHNCGCNVLSMDTHLESAPMSGEMLFRADTLVELLDNCRLADLEVQLEAIAERMTLHIDID